MFYYQLVRLYSMICGPTPTDLTRVQLGKHHGLVRELMREYHGDLDAEVFVPFNTRQRLLVGKQVADSGVPVWNGTLDQKATPLSLVYFRLACEFKKGLYSELLYKDVSSRSWFNSGGRSDACGISAEDKKVFTDVLANVKKYARENGIKLLPAVEGQWWVTFERDLKENQVGRSAVVGALRTKNQAFIVNPNSGSLAAAFAAGNAPPRVGGGGNAGNAAVAIINPSKVDFSVDRPRYAECHNAAALEALRMLAIAAVKDKKLVKAEGKYNLNALGYQENGNVSKYLLAEDTALLWQKVVDARVAALKVEAKRTEIESYFIFNVFGKSADDKSIFQFCSNYQAQQEVYIHDEVTLLDVDAHDKLVDEGDGDEYSSIVAVIGRDVDYIRLKMNKEPYVNEEEEHAAAAFLHQYRKCAKKLNRAVVEGNKSVDGVPVVLLTKHGKVWYHV